MNKDGTPLSSYTYIPLWGVRVFFYPYPNSYKNRNYSAAPHIRPFRASRVAQVRFEARNERIWSTSEQLRFRVLGNLLPMLNSYQKFMYNILP